MDNLIQTHLLLSSPPSVLDGLQEDPLAPLARKILNGNAYEVIAPTFSVKIDVEPVNDKASMLLTLKEWVNSNIIDKYSSSQRLLIAVALLQTFVQNNFTGPAVPIESNTTIFANETLNPSHEKYILQLLAVLGQPAYHLCDDSIYLVLSILLLEELTDQVSLFDPEANPENYQHIPKDTDTIKALAYWWRCRAILVQLTLVSEPKGPQPILASSFLSSVDIAHAVVNGLPDDIDESFKRSVYTIYYLENCKCSLEIQTEHLCLPSLTKVKKLTNFQFILTGARAKRTKFQQVSHAGLIILARSSDNSVGNKEAVEAPEMFDLDSELLLEKPIFDSIGTEPIDEQIVKKQKFDETNGYQEDKLLPVALRQESIPQILQDLDPNNQPSLSPYDTIQLLLRLYTIRQTTANNPLVEEEMNAIISGIIYREGSKNWTIFSRSLWERSILETKRAKTIERGLLQMQSLVEELGLKIKTKMIPDRNNSTSSSYTRLKYVYQLPFIPRWSLDATLAEKFMSMGVLRSAVEIYERLGMSCEAALCYAAVGDEKQAETILVNRINEYPEDARAFSILGDIRQDPSLWEKSWEIGKYVNAKNSLGRYYYNPPSGSGLKRNNDLALKHLNDSLSIFPLSFDTWYFYGCIGLECGRMQLAAEAFSRCTTLDETHSLSWSNLSAAYVEMGKLKEAHSCLKKAVTSDSQKNWRIWENYMIVSTKLGEWEDVLLSFRHLVEIGKDKRGETCIDLAILEKLVEILVSTDFPTDPTIRMTYFQQSCMEFVCQVLPSIVTTSVRLWKVVAKVELWRKRPWVALECHEKAFRAISHSPDLTIDEKIWNESVEACDDLVAAYESLGEMDGRYGAGDVVCKNWNYKARSTIKSLMSKGKNYWEDSDGWEKLLDIKASL